jgi:hypothetical protein
MNLLRPAYWRSTLAGRGKSHPGLFPGMKTSGFRGRFTPGTASLTCGRLFVHSLPVPGEPSAETLAVRSSTGRPRLRTGLLLGALALGLSVAGVGAGAAEPDRVFSIGEGAYSLRAPEGWRRVQPKFGMIEAEFAIPPGEAGQQPGRMTVMGAGGKIEDNLDRWYGQFSQPDGSATKSKATTKKMTIAGCEVTLVDVPGTYQDAPMGPFAGGKKIERTDYRMLAAILETPEHGNYFLKFYGPATCVSQHADGFRTMVEGLVAAKPAAAR